MIFIRIKQLFEIQYSSETESKPHLSPNISDLDLGDTPCSVRTLETSDPDYEYTQALLIAFN
jgi:hypothetical protein